MLADPISRRTLLARLAAAGVGSVALSMLAGCGSSSSSNVTTTGPGSTPATAIDNANFPGIVGRDENEVVLNYALTLESIEADLYRQALNRAAGITNYQTQALSGDPNGYSLKIASGAVNNPTNAFSYLVQFAYVEATHRSFLTSVLNAVHAPIATAPTNGYAFPNGGDPGADLFTILSNLLILEESGVRAYLGAVPFATSPPNAPNSIAQAAASILSTEARHSAALAYSVNKDIGPGPGTAATPDLQVTIQGNAVTYPQTNTFEYASRPTDVLTTLINTFYVK